MQAPNTQGDFRLMLAGAMGLAPPAVGLATQ